MTAKTHSSLLLRPLSALLFAILLFLFWWRLYPQALGYHEQYQLFLFTGAYLAERLSVAGGLASWLGEFVVQFFYVPWLGAALLALLFFALQQSCRPVGHRRDETLLAFILSFVVPLLVLFLMGNPEALPTYLVALTLVMTCRRLPARVLLALFPLLWWALGPLAWVTVPAAVAELPSCRKTLRIVLALGWCAATQTLLTALLLGQYPLFEVWTGIEYCRIPMYVPVLGWVIALVAAALPFVQRLALKAPNANAPIPLFVLTFVLIMGAFVGIRLAYDKGTWEQIRCDQLVRNNRWDELLSTYNRRRPADNYIADCLNLALAMKGELDERMYYAGDGGTEALIRPYENNSFSLLPSAEAFFRCGLINEALRYFYDSQEAILTCRKSGRCTQRMVECYLVDGRYDVARKHLDLLSHSLFYRRWAQELMPFAVSDEVLESHPVYARLRQMRGTQDFLFAYDELYKMFGILYLHDRSNTLAFEYYVANCRLLGIQP